MFKLANPVVERPIKGSILAVGTVEALRRNTLVLVGRVIAALSLVAVLPALVLLASGQYLPFVTAISGLATGIAVFLAGRKSDATAVSLLIVGMSVIGAVHTILNPALVDFGLAIVSLVPVLAALLGDRKTRRLGWFLFAGALVAAAFSKLSTGMVAETQLENGGTASAVAYLAFALMTAISAFRLSAVLEHVDKAQVETLRYLIEDFRYVVLRLAPGGETLFVSHSVETLFGCQRFELTGQGLTERVHVQDRPAYLTALSEAANDDRPRTIEMRVRRDEDSAKVVPHFVWVECGLSPIHPAPGVSGPFEVMVLMRDISARVAQHEEMEQAKRAAQDASQAKSRFLATIGHELRTPLNAVVGFSDMLRNGIGTASAETQHEYADLIHQSGRHLLDTVNMLLDMSRIEAGKFELQIEAFAPESLVAPSISLVEPLAKSRRVGISVEVAPDLPRMLGDERAYRQIAINLLSNAVKFSNPGGEVRISLTRRGRHVALAIVDDGIGMDAATVARLGEPFFQAHDGLSRRFEGSGLGLSIVKGLIDLHQGRLEVSSWPGKGTTMTVLMPISGPAVLPAPAEVIGRMSATPTITTAPAYNPVRRRAAR